MYDTLITPELLAAHIGEPNWVICDCRFVLSSPDAGRAAYLESHIPGALYFHLDHDLAGPLSPSSGRHPLPDPERLAAAFGRAGVTDGVQIVAYDDANGAIAARLWWLARWLGHRDAAVLEGGWQSWVAGGRQLSADIPAPVPQNFTVRRDDTMWVSSAEVLETVVGRLPGRVLDARAHDRFQGRNETLDPVAGHVPGAASVPFAGNLEPTGRFKSPTELRRRIEQALNGSPPDRAICMCGSGVTACHNLLAMEAAGMRGARLYPGSWSEWIRDPSRPIAVGD